MFVSTTGAATSSRAGFRTRKGIKRLQGRPARLAAMADSQGTPLAFAAKRPGDGQLSIVANNGPADETLKVYRKRWQIECLFGDSKTRAHGYRTKSWFRLGFDQLGKWILQDPDRAADVWRRIWPKRNNAFLNPRVV